MPTRWQTVIAALALLVSAGIGRAADEPPEQNVFRDNTEDVLRAAGTLAGFGCTGGQGTPAILGLLLVGEQQHLWKLQGDRAIELRPGFLKFVHDATEKNPIGLMVGDRGEELEVYCEALWKASLVSPGAGQQRPPGPDHRPSAERTEAVSGRGVPRRG